MEPLEVRLGHLAVVVGWGDICSSGGLKKKGAGG